VKKVNNAKSVVGHQVLHQLEAPILFGSLNTVLLNKGIHANNLVHAHIMEHCSSSNFNSNENCNFLTQISYCMVMQKKTEKAHLSMLILLRDR
jgi:hypothetical protein